MKKIYVFLMLMTVMAALGACGRQSMPDRPQPSTYPKVYPAE